MKVSFIINSTKKRARRVAEDLNLGKFIHEHEVHFTRGRGHAIELSAQAAGRNQLVIAVGGDGTINECVNGIMKGSHRYLGVIPCGTGNDFARTVHTCASVDELSDLLEKPKYFEMDVCKSSNLKGSRYFVNIADTGMGAAVVQTMSKVPKWIPGSLRFSSSIFRTVMTFKNQFLQVKWEGGEWKGSSKILVAANGRYFGFGLGIAPDANVSDGTMDLVIAGDISMLDYFKYIRKVRLAKPVSHPEVQYLKSPWVEIEGIGKVEQDGELVMELPIRMEVIPKAINVLEKKI